MKNFFPLLALALVACASDPVHQAHIAVARARLPYVTHTGLTHSMETVIAPSSVRLVESKAYDQLQTGEAVVFWPEGYPNPVCHFIGHRIGTDSWETHGMNQDSDLTNGLGFLLTRENYIGVIR